jgi:hypothetical protein
MGPGPAQPAAGAISKALVAYGAPDVIEIELVRQGRATPYLEKALSGRHPELLVKNRVSAFCEQPETIKPRDNAQMSRGQWPSATCASPRRRARSRQSSSAISGCSLHSS